MPELDFDSAVPVRVRLEPLNSLNNRFKVDPLIRNRQAVAAPAEPWKGKHRLARRRKPGPYSPPAYRRLSASACSAGSPLPTQEGYPLVALQPCMLCCLQRPALAALHQDPSPALAGGRPRIQLKTPLTPAACAAGRCCPWMTTS